MYLDGSFFFSLIASLIARLLDDRITGKVSRQRSHDAQNCVKLFASLRKVDDSWPAIIVTIYRGTIGEAIELHPSRNPLAPRQREIHDVNIVGARHAVEPGERKRRVHQTLSHIRTNPSGFVKFSNNRKKERKSRFHYIFLSIFLSVAEPSNFFNVSNFVKLRSFCASLLIFDLIKSCISYFSKIIKNV